MNNKIWKIKNKMNNKIREEKIKNKINLSLVVEYSPFDNIGIL
jgi:hypothetical protein